MTLVARSYEADTQQHINNTIYMDWLGEALAQARAGASDELGMSEVSPRYYHIQYVHPARPGNRLRIVTQAMRTGSRRLSAVQTIQDDTTDAVAVECHSEHLLRRPLP
jgi:acyl-CoA thioesterase FadM